MGIRWQDQAARPWFNAVTVDGVFIHGDTDVDALIAWCRDVVCDQDDVIISDGQRVLAIVSEGRGVIRLEGARIAWQLARQWDAAAAG